jgi:predicted DNA-binding transcriptional regulator YafY
MSKDNRSHLRCMERLIKLDSLIRSGNCKSAKQAATKLEVNSRTVMRDMEILKERLGAPLKYDRLERRWFYTDRTFSIPVIQMTEGELVAVFLVERLMKHYQGTSFEKHLKTAFEKIILSLPEQISINLTAFTEAYSFEVGPVSEINANTFDIISHALSNHKTVEISYYTQSREELNTRSINPYHLHNFQGIWYIIAFDHLRKEIRDFHLSRVRSVRETQECFKLQDNFNINTYLNSGFTMMRGKESHIVEIEFDPYQARWIREREKWHSSEKREELPNGGLLLKIEVGELDAIKRFVLQYGSHAKVLHPPLLKRMIKQELEKMLEQY